MRHTARRFSTSLSLLLVAALAACGETEISYKLKSVSAEEFSSGVQLREGAYGIVRSGDLSFGDSEVTWTIYAQKPLQLAWSLQGSNGSVGGESIFTMSEGKAVYLLRLSQEEVKGEDFLGGLGVLGGEEASDAVLAAVPDFETSSAFRYRLEVEVLDTEVNLISLSVAFPELQTTTSSKTTASSSSSGWVPGSVKRGAGAGGSRIASAKGGEFLEQYELGETLYLAHCMELPSENGSIAAYESGDELMVRYSTDSEEKREVPLSEYEGRAWALKLTLTEAE
ncbi:MAG TPA: hypothetical protein EYF98_00645 [Planctomycetes bacterium]|nr:hypothetical protein [Planctomycetota bacterium]